MVRKKDKTFYNVLVTGKPISFDIWMSWEADNGNYCWGHRDECGLHNNSKMYKAHYSSGMHQGGAMCTNTMGGNLKDLNKFRPSVTTKPHPQPPQGVWTPQLK